MMFQTFVESEIELGSILEKSASDEEIIEIKDILARYSTDVISFCAFGIQCNCLKNPDAEFRQRGRKVFVTSVRNTIMGVVALTVPRLLTLLKLSSLDPKISKYFRNMVEETVNYRETKNITRNDFMHLLIQIKDKCKLEEDSETLEQNDLGTLENRSNEEGMHTVISCIKYIFCFFPPCCVNLVTM
jgi:cytochrome P450 family 6